MFIWYDLVIMTLHGLMFKAIIYGSRFCCTNSTSVISAILLHVQYYWCNQLRYWFCLVWVCQYCILSFVRKQLNHLSYHNHTFSNHVTVAHLFYLMMFRFWSSLPGRSLSSKKFLIFALKNYPILWTACTWLLSCSSSTSVLRCW